MIFEDRSRKRWRAVVVLAVVVVLVTVVLLADVMLYHMVGSPLGRLPELVPPEVPAAHVLLDAEPGVKPGAQDESEAVDDNGATRRGQGVKPLLTRDRLRTAFVVQGEPSSVRDLQRNLGRLDAVFVDRYACDQITGELREHVEPAVEEIFQKGRVAVFPMFSNTDTDGVWHGREFGELLQETHDAESQNLIESLVDKVDSAGDAGLNVDVEALEPTQRDSYIDWLADLADALHGQGLLLTIDVPMNDPAFDYEEIGKIADLVVVMAYDEHYQGGTPGPIASRDWFLEGVKEITNRIPARKVIVGLGAYGYDWNVDKPGHGVDLSFRDAVLLARDHEAKIETDGATWNSHFTYVTDAPAPERHDVWWLDATGAWNQWAAARRMNVRGVSVWRLGLEEAVATDFLFDEQPERFDLKRLEKIQAPGTVTTAGDGEFLRVLSEPDDGKRELRIKDNQIESATFTQPPGDFFVQRFGAGGGKQVALTFDDGPDDTWTPQVLDLLKQYQTKAAFFVVGEQAGTRGYLLRRIVAEGHILGNHTYHHPNIQQIDSLQLQNELDLTQRRIEWDTGRQALLFRPPYDTDAAPAHVGQLYPLHTAERAGYLIACGSIDSRDFLRPGADRIVQNVMETLAARRGNIVVFHDGGGDRRQTVKAIGILLPRLRAEGYQVVGLDDLLGVSRDALMPQLGVVARSLITGSKVSLWIWHESWVVLVGLFWFAIALSVLRTIVLGTLVYKSRKRRWEADGAITPPVLVLVPAYNEAKVIGKTLAALLRSDYPSFEIVVIDDGSTDSTAAIVHEMALENRNLRLLSQENGGKFSALNRGFRLASQDYTVTIDADTIVMPNTIRELVAPFADAQVDAVCGNVEVGNLKGVLTRFQNVEYVTTQNYDRRAFDALNCISVVPGATGAWRRSAVVEAGGFSDETLTEDADLTLTLLEDGCRIVYAPQARSITEAPEDVRSLFRQRFRWSYGTMQCLWKHRRSVGRGTMGWVALPNIFLFQMIFPVLSPLGDLVLILTLLRGHFGAILIGYGLFLALDLVGSLIAFSLDGKPWRQVWVVLIQRFYYRQFMYVVTLWSIRCALRGYRHGWDKLERVASVTLREEVPMAVENREYEGAGVDMGDAAG